MSLLGGETAGVPTGISSEGSSGFTVGAKMGS